MRYLFPVQFLFHALQIQIISLLLNAISEFSQGFRFEFISGYPSKFARVNLSSEKSTIRQVVGVNRYYSYVSLCKTSRADGYLSPGVHRVARKRERVAKYNRTLR